MKIHAFEIFENKVVIKIRGNRLCETADELLASAMFAEVLRRCLQDMTKRNSILLDIFENHSFTDDDIARLIKTFQFLVKMPGNLLPKIVKGSDIFFRDPYLFNEFVEYLYNYWRSFERFIICDTEGNDLDKSPYRTFHATIEHLMHLIRGVYRDLQEHISNTHPRIYRQVVAGAELGAIAKPVKIPFPQGAYEKLKDFSVIRSILLYPPLILNPPMNKRTGRFERIQENPLDFVDLKKEEWLCYPARVGSLFMLIYFHKKFFELGMSLANLFKLADDEDLKKKPDAVYLFGVPEDALDRWGVFPTVFYDDEKNDMLAAAVPHRSEFGYFGYLKKMVLTLHNIKMMKRGKLPFHGALVRILLRNNKGFTILFIGDTGAGKSETLEAFRQMGAEEIQDLIVIADDMGSLDIDKKGGVIGYGTEIGAFLRLDDLQPGYALGQIDRAIIMSPNQINARIILPVSPFETVIKGHAVDFVLYANNYDEIDEDHPILERFQTSEQALKVFRDGTVMSKGTTTSTGLVHSYFANVFGPPQYKDIHEGLAKKFFNHFFAKGIFVGEVRTRLGLSGWERKGPEEAARELLTMIRG